MSDEMIKIAEEYDAAGRFMARGFVDEFEKLAHNLEFEKVAKGDLPDDLGSIKGGRRYAREATKGFKGPFGEHAIASGEPDRKFRERHGNIQYEGKGVWKGQAAEGLFGKMHPDTAKKVQAAALASIVLPMLLPGGKGKAAKAAARAARRR